MNRGCYCFSAFREEQLESHSTDLEELVESHISSKHTIRVSASDGVSSSGCRSVTATDVRDSELSGSSASSYLERNNGSVLLLDEGERAVLHPLATFSSGRRTFLLKPREGGPPLAPDYLFDHFFN